MTEREKEILNKVQELLVSFYDPQRIILFGSRGKDKSEVNSDFDFAIEDASDIDPVKRNVLLEQIEEVAGLYKVNLVFLEKVHPEFRDIILETGKIIYEKGI